MKKTLSTFFTGPFSAGLALFGLVSVFPASALAQDAAARPDYSARSMVGQMMKSTQGARRYEDTATRRVFILDRRGDLILFKFEDDPEVYVLSATTAQRGDAFLRSASGELFLRVTEMGNVISYFGNRDGAPAAAAAVAAPLDAPAMPDSLTETIEQIADRLSATAGREVTVFGTGAFSRDERWISDALTVARIGVERAGGAASELRTVRLVRMEEPSASYVDGELVLGVDPTRGYAGRPSSEEITAVLANASR